MVWLAHVEEEREKNNASFLTTQQKQIGSDPIYLRWFSMPEKLGTEQNH